ncbi:hypothetical protein PAXRUDRAFT_119798, partial [Paxillus rubicundulus Ve08.2h10]
GKQQTANCDSHWQMASGELRMVHGEWPMAMANGKWQRPSKARWQRVNGEWKMAKGKW